MKLVVLWVLKNVSMYESVKVEGGEFDYSKKDIAVALAHQVSRVEGIVIEDVKVFEGEMKRNPLLYK